MRFYRFGLSRENFARFVLVGGLSALLNNIFVIAFAHNGINYLAASLLAFGPVLSVSYALHTHFTFKTPASRDSFARYTLAMAANFPIWVAALYVFCDLVGVSVVIAAPVTTVLVFLWNYVSASFALVPAGRSARKDAAVGD